MLCIKTCLLFFLTQIRYLISKEFSYINLLRNDIVISSYNLTFINSNEYIKDSRSSLKFFGKVCITQSIESFYNNCYEKYSGYNNMWVLLIDDSRILNSILLYNSYNLTLQSQVSAVIYNKNLISIAEIKSYNNLTGIIPLFAARNDIYTDLTYYDIREEKSNYFLDILWFKIVPSTSCNYLFFVSVCLGIIMTVFYCWWYYNTFRLNANHTTHLQKTISSFPVMRLITALLLVYYIYVSNKEVKSIESELISVYLEIIIQTLVFVYKTFFWFIVFLIASGWQIYRNWISARQLRSFVFYYMMIFLLICFDQILDIVFEKEIYIFSVSDLKNILVYFLFTIITLVKVFGSLKSLLNRYTYAINFLPHYCQSLILKIKIFKNHGLVITIYSLSYFFSLFILKLKYKDDKFLKIVILHIIDHLALILFM